MLVKERGVLVIDDDWLHGMVDLDIRKTFRVFWYVWFLPVDFIDVDTKIKCVDAMS